ncbi:hypothetical protein GOODEAATRI_004419, partial [Goodea atripinnis]
ISYCQGMSDIASPILAVMDNEAHTFICFCGIMKRLEGNFRPDGQLMSIKFQHLKLLVQYSDSEFYSYLVSRGADDLFFCYRWLLLELKREFAFNDALRMLEVTWSSLPPDPPETEVELLGPLLEGDETTSFKDESVVNCLKGDEVQIEKQRRRHMLRPSREEPDMSRIPITEGKGAPTVGSSIEIKAVEYDTSEEIREKSNLQGYCCQKQTSFGEFEYYTAQSEGSLDMEDAEQPQGLMTLELINPRRQSTADSENDPGERTPLIRNCDYGLSPVSSHSVFTSGLPIWKTGSSSSPTSSPANSSWPVVTPDFPANSTSSSAANGTNNLPSPGNTSPSTKANTPSSLKTDSTKPCSLPPPHEFGKGNPFMLFLCLSILLEHRDHIIKNNMDYNEIAMHFDRLVRRHNLSRVLQRAKTLFADYLQSEVWDSEEGDEVSSDSPTTAAPQSPSLTISARPIYRPLASPPLSPNSTYNLATTIPSPSAEVSLSPVS